MEVIEDSRAQEVYERHVRPLSPAAQLRLMALTAQGLAESEGGEAPERHSIMELCGLGAEIWQGVDAQQYVNELRSEWGKRIVSDVVSNRCS